MLDHPVYVDYNATTPVDPRVIAAMSPFWTDNFANPASEHQAGQRVREAVADARDRVAAACDAPPAAVVFTSGSTESINLAIQGVVNALERPAKVVTFESEHKAVLDTCEWLARRGTVVEVLPVDRDGRPDLDVAAAHIDDGTALVSVMAVNNETGVINSVAELAEMARRTGALLHCDATQALGKTPVRMEELGADFISVSSHKVYGPKGVGALLVGQRARGRIGPLTHGGGHEKGLRSGTLNVPGIVGFGAACSVLGRDTSGWSVVRDLRDRLESGIVRLIPSAEIMSVSAPRVNNTVNVRLPGYDAQALLLAMPNVAASTGSACSSASPAPSHVLRAMGLSYEAAQECIRFSFGRFSSTDDVEIVLSSLCRAMTIAVAAGM